MAQAADMVLLRALRQEAGHGLLHLGACCQHTCQLERLQNRVQFLYRG